MKTTKKSNKKVSAETTTKKVREAIVKELEKKNVSKEWLTKHLIITTL